MDKFNHLDEYGNAIMVDVSKKQASEREAIASGSVFVGRKTLDKILERGIKKGDVLSIAQLAGIMGAKKTPELIPLCHPLALTSVKLKLECNLTSNSIDIKAICKVTGNTGVEMEALTAVAVSALTIYDMCKSVDKSMQISNIRLLSKKGGKSGTFKAV